MSKTGTGAASAREPLVFLHVGDLHLKGAGDANAKDLDAILAQISGIAPANAFDFVYLPGDITEDGCADQYEILEEALARHPELPVYLIPGDHDRQHGKTRDFRRFHARVRGHRRPAWPEPFAWELEQPPHGCPETWPVKRIKHYCFARTIRGVRCLFLDMISPGYGRKAIGLDFRLGGPQMVWLNRKLAAAARRNIPCAVFMHAYPDDLREPDDRLDVAGLFWHRRVRLVEMGHTHYNELAHDGRTLYAAARSVGQNEDGSVGYAVGAIDGPVTSWRFRALDRTWPFVLITSPADRRLAAVPGTAETCGMVGDGRGRIRVRALVLSDAPPKYVHGRVDTGPWITMRSAGGRCYEAWLPWDGSGRSIQVEAVHTAWPGHGPDHVDTDVIEPVRAFAAPGEPLPPMPDKPGSDAFSLGPWLGKGVRGDQLGPNRFGRKW